MLVHCVIYFIIIATVFAAKKKKFPLWDDTTPHLAKRVEDRVIRSYLFKDADPKDHTVQFVQDIVDVIYAKQHPRKENCRQKRLLALQMTSTSFEGTGSLLKQVMLSVSIAMHSNRTMVWGLGYPFIFEHTKEVWNNRNNHDILINDEHIDCTQEDAASGPLGCFFETASTCSLADASAAELVQVSENPHNESARVILSEIRKGVSLYQPPFGLFDFIWSKRSYPASIKQELINRQAQLWAAAVAAYVFRLKENLSKSFAEKFDHIFKSEEAVWGIHVRHGDLKALSNVYAYKEIFDFDEYFSAGMAVSHWQKKTPSRIFVATDSIEADRLPEIYADFMKDKAKGALKKKNKPAQKGSGKTPTKAKSSKKEATKDDDDYLDTEDDDDDDDYEKEVDDDGDDEAEEDEDEYETKSQSKKPEAPAKKTPKKASAKTNDYDENDDEDDDDDEDIDDDYDDDEEDDDEDEDDEYGDDGKVDILEKLVKARNALISKYDNWYGGKEPKLSTVGNAKRYRTEHGSHTVAANGGCLRDEKYASRGMRCALNYEAIIHYQTLEEHRVMPRSMRLMCVLLESIEDIYILSRTDTLIAQASSHFSTAGALLIWARTGAADHENRVLYLDKDSIAAGFTPTAYLHGMNLLNGTNGVDTTSAAAGAERWWVHTRAFVSGLPNYDHITNVKVPFNPFGEEARMQLVNGLPHIMDQLFYLEAKSWLGGKYKPFLPGHCPGKLKKGEDIMQYLTNVINLGVDHLNNSHIGQAMQCWSDAKQALADNPKIGNKKKSEIEEISSILKENMAYVRIMRYAEMAINENHNTREFLEFNDKYMQRPYDGVDYENFRGDERPSGVDSHMSSGSDSGRREHMVSPEGKRLWTLEEVNEEIIELEDKLGKMKSLRDKLINAHYMYINGQLDVGKNQLPGTEQQRQM